MSLLAATALGAGISALGGIAGSMIQADSARRAQKTQSR